MTNKPHLEISANEYFEEAVDLEQSDPKTAARFKIDAHEILACFYMANENDSYIDELKTVLKLKLEYVSDYNEKLWPESQIEYAFIALAAGEMEKAKVLCSYDTDIKNTHNFSILLNCKLRKLVGAPQVFDEPQYKPTKSELGLFLALDSVINKEVVDFSLLQGYWKATKSKRYESTVFEHRDLFTEAISNAEKTFNK